MASRDTLEGARLEAEHDIQGEHWFLGLDEIPCYRCRQFDPWHGDGYGLSFEDWGYHPCEYRLNFCLTYRERRMCRKYVEAGKTFWEAEVWRAKNRVVVDGSS